MTFEEIGLVVIGGHTIFIWGRIVLNIVQVIIIIACVVNILV